MLKASVRYSGLALGNNITNMALVGTAPFIATWLIDITGTPRAGVLLRVLCAAHARRDLFVKETKASSSASTSSSPSGPAGGDTGRARSSREESACRSSPAEITEVLYRYARAVDRKDFDRVADCYFPDAIDNHGG